MYQYIWVIGLKYREFNYFNLRLGDKIIITTVRLIRREYFNPITSFVCYLHLFFIYMLFVIVILVYIALNFVKTYCRDINFFFKFFP